MAVQNGNNVSTEISGEFSAGVKAGGEKPGLGVDASVKFGYSIKKDHKTGKQPDSLLCHGGANGLSPPVEVVLTSKGRVVLNSTERSGGYAQSHTKVYAVYIYGFASGSCPGLENAVCRTGAVYGDIQRATGDMDSFYTARGTQWKAGEWNPGQATGN